VLGGIDEFFGPLPTRASSSRSLANSARMIDCASGGCRAMTSSVISSVMLDVLAQNRESSKDQFPKEFRTLARGVAKTPD
jgi:hypothetical protein